MYGSRPADNWATIELPFSQVSCSHDVIGPAFTVEMDLTAGQRVMATAEQVAFGQVVRFVESCDLAVECYGDGGWLPYTTEFVVPHDGIYYAVFRRAYAGAPVDLNYAIGIVEDELCETGVDEDMDGAAGCDDSDCLYHPFCEFSCPEPVGHTLIFQGDHFQDDWPDLVNFDQIGGCLSDPGGDIFGAVTALAGDVIDVISPSGGPLAQINIVHESDGECLPEMNGNTCVHSARRGGAYTVAVAGVHYIHLSITSNSWNQAYDWQVRVTTPTGDVR